MAYLCSRLALILALLSAVWLAAEVGARLLADFPFVLSVVSLALKLLF